MRKMTCEEQKKFLRVKAVELSSRITNGDNESMRLMDDWYDTIRLLEHYGEHKGLISLCGGDLPMIEDYINEECILLVTEEVFRRANRAMQ